MSRRQQDREVHKQYDLAAHFTSATFALITLYTKNSGKYREIFIKNSTIVRKITF